MDQLKMWSQEAHPLETGGLLIGVFAGDQPWIVAANVAQSKEAGLAHFRLPAGSTGQVIAKCTQADKRLGYLGDWHSHPVDQGPSETDIATLKSGLGRGDARFPLMLIVRRKADNRYYLDGQILVSSGIESVLFIAAGDLPRHEPLMSYFANEDGDQSLCVAI